MPPLKQALAAGCLLLFLQILAFAAPGAVVAPVLHAEIIARGDPAKPGEMYWALTALPAEKDIIPGIDASVRIELTKALKALAQESVTEWNFKPRAEGNFRTALGLKMPEAYNFTIQSPPPPDGSSDRHARKVDLTAKYESGVVIPVVRRKGLAVHIVVTGSRVISENPVATTLGNLARHGVAGLGDLSEEEKAFQVWVADAKSQGSGSDWRDSPEHLHACDVAAAAFASAKKNALAEAVVNKGSESAKVVTEIRNALQRGFQLSPTWETVSTAEAKDLLIFHEETNTWVATIPLHAVNDVRFEFSGIQTEGQEIPWATYPYASQLIGKKVKAEKEIEEKTEPEFLRLRGKVLTLDELHGQTKPILTMLDRNRKVLHASGPGSRDYDLVFSGVWLPRETEFTAGIGYSTDKGLGGKLGLTSRNLLPVKNSLLNFSIEAGTEKQEGHLSYTLPDYYKSADGRLSSQLDLTADYKRDDDQKLGAPDKTGVEEKRATGALKNVLHFVANPAAVSAEAGNQPGTWAYGATLETTLGYSDTQLDTSGIRDVQDGSLFFALANLQQHGWRELRRPEVPGIGKLEMFWQLRGKKGFTAGLGDFDFFSGETRGGLTLYFGDKSSRDFFARVLGGGAINSSNTPVFEQFRLGGDTIVRGLEEGERLARGVVYDSVEGGVRAGRIWQWISPTPETGPVAAEPGTSTTKPGPSVGGFDLGNTYVSLFFDHAYITRPSSRSGADKLSRDLESVGAALEIPLPTSAVQGRLQLGYAWSPQSIHEQGRSFVSVTLDFP